MKSRQTRFWMLVFLLVAGGALIHSWDRAGEARVARRGLKEFPARVGEWRQRGGDIRFDAPTEAVLHVSDYVMRDYELPDGRGANLYVGYYETQRGGATYHSPLNCLPGAGWVMSEPAVVKITPAGGGASFEANRFIIENGDDKNFLIYWYQGRGRAVASEYWDKAYTMFDSVRRRRSDGAMVRVTMRVKEGGSEERALATATELAAQIAPHLREYVPE